VSEYTKAYADQTEGERDAYAAGYTLGKQDGLGFGVYFGFSKALEGLHISIDWMEKICGAVDVGLVGSSGLNKILDDAIKARPEPGFLYPRARPHRDLFMEAQKNG
jgi:hypothetical protein